MRGFFFALLLLRHSQAQSCSVTLSDQEGPYYLPSMPARAVLSTRIAPSELFTYRGRVLDQWCCPLASVAVDIWHADAQGVYTFVAPFPNRGVVRTAADGSFEFRSELPGSYPARCGAACNLTPRMQQATSAFVVALSPPQCALDLHNLLPAL